MRETRIAVEELTLPENQDPIHSMANEAGMRSDNYTTRDRKKLTDEQLVGLFLEKRDEEAFNEIVDRYADKIYRLALRITRNPSDAEDILQEAFLSIEKLDALREGSKFSTWFYRVALNSCFMQLRAEKKHRKNLSLDDYQPYMEAGALEAIQRTNWHVRPDETVLGRERMERIEKALGELPAAYRVVFHLRDIEGFSNLEAAKILDLSLPNVKSRIHRARLLLREKLSDYFYGENK